MNVARQIEPAELTGLAFHYDVGGLADCVERVSRIIAKSEAARARFRRFLNDLALGVVSTTCERHAVIADDGSCVIAMVPSADLTCLVAELEALA